MIVSPTPRLWQFLVFNVHVWWKKNRNFLYWSLEQAYWIWWERKYNICYHPSRSNRGVKLGNWKESRHTDSCSNMQCIKNHTDLKHKLQTAKLHWHLKWRIFVDISKSTKCFVHVSPSFMSQTVCKVYQSHKGVIKLQLCCVQSQSSTLPMPR